MELDEKFEESQALALLTEDILHLNFPELGDASRARFRIMFTNQESEREAGQCRKLDDQMRFLLKTDYLILINKPTWDKCSSVERLRILCHELRHILLDEDNPKGRKHSADPEHPENDFCEIGSRDHDKISYRLADAAISNAAISKMSAALKLHLGTFTTQKELVPA